MEKKKATFSLITVLLVLFMLTGCTVLKGTSSTDDEGRPLGGAVYSGTNGLKMEFIRDLPQQIFEGSAIDLIVELRNVGAYDIKGGKLYLAGFDDGIIQISEKQKLFSIDGKEQFNIEGGFDTVSFRSSTVSLPPGTDSYRPKFILSACYNYETQATPVVCVDPTPQLGTQDKACTPGSANVGGGQGGPVAITSVVGEAIPGKARFKIEISNSGGGKVARMDHCPYNLEYSDLNYVDYQISMSGGTGDCKPISPLKLVDGRATIYCTFDVRGSTAYTTPLSIRLIYDYMDSITKDLEIRSIG